MVVSEVTHFQHGKIMTFHTKLSHNARTLRVHQQLSYKQWSRLVVHVSLLFKNSVSYTQYYADTVYQNAI